MKPQGQQRDIQHFVTAAYLVGFAPNATRGFPLWVYERNSVKSFRLIPDEAAKRRNYYSIPEKDGGFDDVVDTMLTALEGQAMPSLKKLLAGDYKLSTFEPAASATNSNRRVRTHTHGGVAGVGEQPPPLCRSSGLTRHDLRP